MVFLILKERSWSIMWGKHPFDSGLRDSKTELMAAPRCFAWGWTDAWSSLHAGSLQGALSEDASAISNWYDGFWILNFGDFYTCGLPIETDETGLMLFDRWSLIVDLHFAAGTTVTQHAEVIVDSSFPGWELGRRAASANAHINNKIITVVTDAWYIYEIPAYYWQIIFHQIFTITATYNIGNWIRILLFYQFDSICIFWTSYFMARCDAKGGGHFFLDLGIGPDDGSARGQWRTSA